jgi:hypothetical protein
MKLIRLPSGPLACVFPIQNDMDSNMERAKDSGVYRAFSGSVEAAGESEAQALEALDEEVRRLSVPPPAEITEFEQARAANDVQRWEGPGMANAPWRQRRVSEFETFPAPASSSRR